MAPVTTDLESITNRASTDLFGGAFEQEMKQFQEKFMESLTESLTKQLGFDLQKTKEEAENHRRANVG